MRHRLVVLAGVVIVGAVGYAAAGLAAPAHNNGCHSHHTCPSDHHTYVWFDAAGNGWDCAEPGASERTAADTTLITYDGLPYYCHAAGSAPPPATTTTAPTISTTTTAPTTSTTATTASVPTVTVAVPTSTAPAVTTPAPTPAPSSGTYTWKTVGATTPLKTKTKSGGCKLAPLPDRRCSPGAYFNKLTKAVICAANFRTPPLRHVTEKTMHGIESEYGMTPKPYGSALEIDHIVSLELGGSNDPANLFPERATPAPSWRIKDKLENRLHDMVCAGSIGLRAAQQKIASNWMKLYKTVYGNAPLR